MRAFSAHKEVGSNTPNSVMKPRKGSSAMIKEMNSIAILEEDLCENKRNIHCKNDKQRFSTINSSWSTSV
uniref:Uncharacterized protein n=1 Tax=Romanomermis culicivorax TaxID=13658 RepID=A0A915K1C1_ROMCU